LPETILSNEQGKWNARIWYKICRNQDNIIEKKKQESYQAGNRIVGDCFQPDFFVDTDAESLK